MILLLVVPFSCFCRNWIGIPDVHNTSRNIFLWIAISFVKLFHCFEMAGGGYKQRLKNDQSQQANYCTKIIRIFFTPPRSRGGVVFSLKFVCVSQCLSVCVCLSSFACEQNSDEPIWTWFSINGCLTHWLKPY